jgi:hypothetical protein
MFERKSQMNKDARRNESHGWHPANGTRVSRHLLRYLYGVSLQNTRQQLQKHLTLDQIWSDHQQSIISTPIYSVRTKEITGKKIKTELSLNTLKFVCLHFF